jgi:hypothetical protein
MLSLSLSSRMKTIDFGLRRTQGGRKLTTLLFRRYRIPGSPIRFQGVTITAAKCSIRAKKAYSSVRVKFVGFRNVMAGTVGPSSRRRERTPTQNFLQVLTEASGSPENRNGPQTAERPRNEESRRFKPPFLGQAVYANAARMVASWSSVEPTNGQASNRPNDNTDRSRACQ